MICDQIEDRKEGACSILGEGEERRMKGRNPKERDHL